MKWDVIVIGGGPSGMMAAGRAAERGLKVLLLEKNKTLGKKLLITGGGRCNVTNAEFDNRKLLSKFKDAKEFLFSAFSQWSVQETLEFFNNRNMPTKVEALQRVFPVSDSAQSVWNVLVEYMNASKEKVTIQTDSPVTGFKIEENKITGVVLKNKEILQAKNYILATGGTSRPETGSTGDGFDWLKKIGHTIIPTSTALVPIALKDAWAKKLAGITLPEVKINIFQNNVKQNSVSGKILFTHVGISGPTVLNMSSEISELLKYGEVTLLLDILPKHDHGKLNSALQEVFKEHSNKKIKNSLANLIPAALVPVVFEIAKIDPEKFSHSVTREERLALISIIKAIPLHVKGLLGVDKAIVTSGGVPLTDVDLKTMQSRLFPNLFLVGDVLHIDRPSGGYSLQLCWTTGFVAGNSVAV
jgi:predicted Rossmann fold flavoprotein